MKYAKLGNSDLNVSRICMGCMGFGDSGRGQHSWTIDEEHTREIIRRGLELGVNFYDTAIAYQSGPSEQYVGRALRDFAKRDEVVVATKFLPRTQEEISSGVTGQQHVETMINASLKNLGMDYVDLYIYHIWLSYFLRKFFSVGIPCDFRRNAHIFAQFSGDSRRQWYSSPSGHPRTSRRHCR